jgi:3,4-dihydroxy 2-butanone 4-phosphate synthase/GTP cyclohydrolase II
MEKMILQASATLPTKWGKAQIRAYSTDSNDRMPLVALIFGKLSPTMVVRLHSECLTGDIFSSLKCDCGEQLHQSLSVLGKKGGVLLYLRQEGRSIGLINKLKAYNLQEKGANTIEANHQLGFGSDLRNYDSAVQVLKGLGIAEVHLLTNNPEKQKALEEAGIVVSKRLPIEVAPQKESLGYLKTKKDLMGHFLENID